MPTTSELAALIVGDFDNSYTKRDIIVKRQCDVYTVEFQKRGLPHAHIILCLSDSDKIISSFDVDQLISAEIPDKLEDPELYELVGSYMVHSPCGRSSRSAPCMKDGKCSKYFPKRFCARTMLDEHGYPTYRRRDDGHMVSRKVVKLDNRSVVPYNATLLKLFGGHLNIEKTNQSRAIKYLFKYISKGNDRVIAGIYNKNDQPVLNNHLMKSLTTSIVVMYLHVRRRGEFLVLIYTIDIHRGEIKFPSSSTTVNILQGREACFALGLLDDDKEYIDAIKEASSWASGNYLRHFFTSMLLSHCLSQPAIVWEQTKELICEDLLHINHGDKGWCTVMLIRNIDQAAGMCNGTRLQISQLGKNVIKAKALNGTSIGEEI
ncbi:hypothetical protein K1719_033613 [Acacia pycnantha]|nr:hypothetical protein K1719_033613 [Acacia pycnantha]